MKCKKCQTDNLSVDTICKNCGAELKPSGSFHEETLKNSGEGSAYIVGSVFLMLCWCLPFGLLALIYSILAQIAEDNGRPGTGKEHWERARFYLMIGFCIGLVFLVGAILWFELVIK